MAYNPFAALFYAAMYSHRVCDDGFVCVVGGKTLADRFEPCTPITGLQFSGRENDCAHFVSRCLFWGGIRTIPNDGPYHGIAGAPRLVSHLRSVGAQVVKEFAELPPDGKERDKLREEIRQLSPGDVIAYSHVDNANKYKHIAIHCGDAKVTCHTASRQNEDFDHLGLGTMRLVTLLHFRNAKTRVPKKIEDVFADSTPE